MDKVTLLNMHCANRELFKCVVSQVGEFRMLEPKWKGYQTGKDARNVSCLFEDQETTPKVVSWV